MAKFIEVKKAKNPDLFRFECDNEDDYILINVEYIIAIIPKGKICEIRLLGINGKSWNIRVQHSATWVMGLINGTNDI